MQVNSKTPNVYLLHVSLNKQLIKNIKIIHTSHRRFTEQGDHCAKLYMESHLKVYRLERRGRGLPADIANVVP